MTSRANDHASAAEHSTNDARPRALTIFVTQRERTAALRALRKRSHDRRLALLAALGVTPDDTPALPSAERSPATSRKGRHE
jgi:hypothetical protein